MQKGTRMVRPSLMRFVPDKLIVKLMRRMMSLSNKIALRLNQRPRKTLNFRCPADKLSESVALTT